MANKRKVQMSDDDYPGSNIKQMPEAKRTRRVTRQLTSGTIDASLKDEHGVMVQSENGIAEHGHDHDAIETGKQQPASSAHIPAIKNQDQVAKQKRRRKIDPECKTQLMLAKREANKRADEAEASRQGEAMLRQQVEEELQHQKDRLRALQEQHLAGRNQGRDYLQDDNTIQTNFDILIGMIAAWAADWSYKGPVMQHLDKKSLETLTSNLRKNLRCTLNTQSQEHARDRLYWAPMGCRITTEALLCMQIVETVLKRPFHFLRTQSISGMPQSERTFEAIHTSLREEIPETRIWTSRTLRSLYNSHQYKDSITEPINDDTLLKHRNDTYARLSSELLDTSKSPLSPLIKPCDFDEVKHRRGDLDKIFKAAGKLSLQLWVQDACLTSEFPELANAQDIMSAQDSRYEAHGLCKPALKDTSQEELVVDLWIRPDISLIRYEGDGTWHANLLVSKACYMHFNGEKCRQNREKLERIDQTAATTDDVSTKKPDVTNTQIEQTNTNAEHKLGDGPDAVMQYEHDMEVVHEKKNGECQNDKEIHVDDNLIESAVDQSTPDTAFQTSSTTRNEEQSDISSREEAQEHNKISTKNVQNGVECMSGPVEDNSYVETSAAPDFGTRTSADPALGLGEGGSLTDPSGKSKPSMQLQSGTSGEEFNEERIRRSEREPKEAVEGRKQEKQEDDEECIITDERKCPESVNKAPVTKGRNDIQPEQPKRQSLKTLEERHRRVSQAISQISSSVSNFASLMPRADHEAYLYDYDGRKKSL